MGKRKKTLKEYKEQGKRAPWIPYLYDRTFPYFVVLMTLSAVVGSYLFIKEGFDSFNRMQESPKAVSPYQNITASNSPGMNWGSKLITEKPPTVSKWQSTGTTKPQHAVEPKNCAYIKDIPTSLLSTYVSSGSGVETRIQVYGAGQAAKNFNAYISALEKCGSVETASDDTAGVAKYDDNFIMTIGDSIISATTQNSEDREKVLKFYMKEAESTLKDSGCLALNVTKEDANRSFFYDSKSYTGLKESKKLETDVKIDNLPTPTSIKRLTIKNKYASEPESPLPKDFPELPSEKEKPNLPDEVKNETAFEGTAVYKIMDENGPGCGWKWSAQNTPQYDEKDMLDNEKRTIADKQKEIDDKASAYVNKKLEWAFSIGLTAPKIDEWNTYVNKVNKVHKKWTWLDNEREKLRTPWYNYVDAHRDWETFDDRKDKASDQYDKKLEECQAKQDELDEWEDKWGDKAKEDKKDKEKNDNGNSDDDTTESPEDPDNPNPTEEPEPEPTETQEPPKENIPDKPEGCSNLPQKPAIISQEKPLEPKAPKIPEGVTIPDSWPKV